MGGGEPKTWFITGSSKGLGRVWAEAALGRGDKVAATARDSATLAPLVERYGDSVLALDLNVDDRAAGIAAVRAAREKFGRLDVVVNNAGYGLFGAVEEVTEEDARAQIETNLFGALWVTQAALPFMREQGSGHIVQVSSIGGVSTFLNVGIYNASKWGLEGLSQALAAEVEQFGIKVTMVEPIGYTTDWGGSSATHSPPIPVYDGVREGGQEAHLSRESGNPAATGRAILELVDSDDPPLRCFFGNWALDYIEAEYAERLATWKAWDPVAQIAHGG
jgi:NAD(P)-dependent dehydrogenase (short-subunit alcohol dehydrogenase family)